MAEQSSELAHCTAITNANLTISRSRSIFSCAPVVLIFHRRHLFFSFPFSGLASIHGAHGGQAGRIRGVLLIKRRVAVSQGLNCHCRSWRGDLPEMILEKCGCFMVIPIGAGSLCSQIGMGRLQDYFDIQQVYRCRDEEMDIKLGKQENGR